MTSTLTAEMLEEGTYRVTITETRTRTAIVTVEAPEDWDIAEDGPYATDWETDGDFLSNAEDLADDAETETVYEVELIEKF
jgi:hypothetical protein